MNTHPNTHPNTNANTNALTDASQPPASRRSTSQRPASQRPAFHRSASQRSTSRPPTPQRSVFQRSAARVAVRGALSAGAVLGFTLGIAATPASASTPTFTPIPVSTPASVSTTAVSPLTYPIFDHNALGLSSTTDTLPEDQAAQFETIAGSIVYRIYYLHNRGLLPLDHVTVVDPGNNGAAIHCVPSGTSTVATLLPLAWTTCWATFTASSGEHHSTATASGTVFLFSATISAADPTGYTAVAPGLGASLSFTGPGHSAADLPAGQPASATLTVHNSGSVVLTQLSTSSQPPLSFSNCDNGSALGELGPGESAACNSVLIPAVGAHTSSVTVTGTWRWDHPITEHGPQPPETLTIQTAAEAGYTGIPVASPTPPPPPRTPQPPSPAPPPPTPAPPVSSPAVVIPQPQQPTPSPTPTPTPAPSHHPTPTATPTQVPVVLQQAVSQFRASRGLPLPMKVLVIVVVPAVAAAAGARRLAAARR